MELETLCIQLGIEQYIPALSEFRDNILRETAAKLQLAAFEVAAKTAELEVTQEALTDALARISQQPEETKEP